MVFHRIPASTMSFKLCSRSGEDVLRFNGRQGSHHSWDATMGTWQGDFLVKHPLSEKGKYM